MTKSKKALQDLQIRYVLYTPKANSCFIDGFKEEPKNLHRTWSGWLLVLTANYFLEININLAETPLGDKQDHSGPQRQKI